MYLLTLKEIENQSPQTPVAPAASSSLTSTIDNESLSIELQNFESLKILKFKSNALILRSLVDK